MQCLQREIGTSCRLGGVLNEEISSMNPQEKIHVTKGKPRQHGSNMDSRAIFHHPRFFTPPHRHHMAQISERRRLGEARQWRDNSEPCRVIVPTYYLPTYREHVLVDYIENQANVLFGRHIPASRVFTIIRNLSHSPLLPLLALPKWLNVYQQRATKSTNSTHHIFPGGIPRVRAVSEGLPCRRNQK